MKKRHIFVLFLVALPLVYLPLWWGIVDLVNHENIKDAVSQLLFGMTFVLIGVWGAFALLIIFFAEEISKRLDKIIEAIKKDNSN